ncbi:peptide ABC transporter permease [Neobacillus bataviensis LMG 21833]|uniref:Peptide ABC transporter permease n=1 Tax=Neobacillus bataviensis LMG 21833 TaxID=1117379 RepID=K6D200_9BACI|nr:ABC transporter permease [Neobacillus bataviensis]EKN66492.1 peptide ABC transporter permease [Neobacillus bataviensis LMG 21833]
MINFILRKVLVTIPMLFIISIIVFFSIQFSPVDPINYLASPDASNNTANLEALREHLGLNDPLYVQYYHWIMNILHGDFGYSILTGQPIAEIIANKLPATLELSVTALLLSTIIGVFLGILSAIKQNSVIDYFSRNIGVIGISIPEFFFGIIIIQIFAIKLGWLPIGGRIDVNDVTFWDRLPNLILPSLALAFAMIAVLLRYTRNSMLDVLNKEFVKTARSKGIPEWKVFFFHAFRNALGPILVILAFRLPMLVGGAVIIETIFAWPGIGSAILASVSSSDYPVIMVTTLMIASAILIASFLVDIISALLDPRIRLE